MHTTSFCPKILRIFLSLFFLSFSVGAFAQSALQLFDKAVEAENNGELSQAEALYTQSYEAFVSEGKGDSVELSKCLHNLSRVYAMQGKMEESRKYCLKALELREKQYGKVSPEYVSTLNNYANTFRYSDIPQALEIQKQVIQLMEQLPTAHPQAAMFYSNLGLYFLNIADIGGVNEPIATEGAIENYEKALRHAEKYSDEYLWLLQMLGDIYITFDRSEDLYRIMALVQENNEHELQKECNEPQCMLERAEYYMVNGDNGNTQECFNSLRAMDLDDEMTAKTYDLYGSFVFETDPEVAAESYITSAKAFQKLSGRSYDYGKALYMSGLSYDRAHDYEKAILQFTQAMDVFRPLSYESDEAMEKLLSCKKEIASCYSQLGIQREMGHDHVMAIQYAKEVLDYYSDPANKPNLKDQADALERLATYQKYAGDYDAAIDNYKKSIEIYQAIGDAIGATNTSSSLTLCYGYAGKKVEYENPNSQMSLYYKQQIDKVDAVMAKEIADLDITRDYLGKFLYATSLGGIAHGYTLKGDYLTALSENLQGAQGTEADQIQRYLSEANDNYAKSIEYYGLYIPALRDAIRDEFRLRSEKERMQIWEGEKSSVAEICELVASLPEDSEDCDAMIASLSGIMYDAVLLSKGILLTSAIEFEEVLNSTNNPYLQDVYAHLKKNQERLKELRAKTLTERVSGEIQRYQIQTDALQLELMRGCSEYADFTNYISYSWRDVQNRLTPEDVAIEFTVVNFGTFDEERFVFALVLTKDMETPEVLPICDLKTAKLMELYAAQEDADETIYSNPVAFSQIWKFIMPYIRDKKRIYFSADGPLNHLAIEYLPLNGKPLSEQFDVYRLSSTKELCYYRKSKPIKKMAVIGNIAYNGEGIVDRSTKRNLNKLRGLEGALVFEDLDESKREIEEIASIMKTDRNRVVVPLQGVQASEKAFRELSGSNVDLLHIATHGAYIDKGDQTDAEAMQNSLLAFAGANRGDEDETNDGLVTAEDIAKMNLRNCDLVVLSACESGLGKLSDDGVFGLQRGFKNAGVHQLMMSLRNVYDVATAEMMTAFYRNLANGSTAREALTAAQTELRSKGYTDAKYWAPFILLDAID